ncbi:uncharacterized protein DUF4395 [Haloactinopolyspora alba]|uniref:Uncharacterized protein DUF4395 n=1 Tax=Haloactinopolyspora alba TaxID=648780 RepID=A0A2P8DK16_9ACTN|nr:DUF4395 domain-containing protein [Haloactinopolyspora alba]PSK97554.1 uncharacterized protein DUF4395 [Haloactinopolyspora alba]
MRATPAVRREIDPRGPRFAAALTTVVLAAVLITQNAWLLAAQTAVFAVGALAGPAAAPYGRLFARAVRPRLAPPSQLEDAAPPRFAQAVGLVFSLTGLAGLLGGVVVLGYVAVGAALAAAFLNAAFGLCLGCETYLAYRRSFLSRSAHHTTEVAP